jgi:dihydrofolate synthase/folylpolyglutamate synthase
VPVVSAPQADEAHEVLERVATDKNCPFVLVGRDVKFERLASSLDGQELAISFQQSAVRLKIPLLGNHQVENAAIAYTALKTSGIPISDEAIQKGFTQAKWPARFEVLRREPPVVIDSAHNRDSALRLRETIGEYFPDRPIILIFCALEDKDISGMLEELKPRLEKVVATRADHPRAPSVDWTAEQVSKAGIPVEAIVPVDSALERALELAGTQKIVLSAGSVAFAGEVGAAWRKRMK